MTGNPRLAWDSYRRFVQGYAEVVAGLPTTPFDVLAADALALSWIMPTPTPPTAPASSPSSMSMGTLSISLCFFDDFDILSSPVGLMLLF